MGGRGEADQGQPEQPSSLLPAHAIAFQCPEDFLDPLAQLIDARFLARQQRW
jgi:hypothetical protein